MYGRNKYLNHLVWLVMRNPRLRRVWQRALYPSGIREVMLLGQPLEIDCQAEIGYYRASIANNSNIYFRDEVPQIVSVASTLRPGCTFVDAGANVGIWTVQMASLNDIVGGVRVMAFEPHPVTFKRLKHNAARFANVTTYNLALSDSKQSLTFYETTTSGVFSVKASDFNMAEKSSAITIPALPLDDYLDDIEDVVLKIDVEGHELEVLRGAQRALARGAIDVVFSDGVDHDSYPEFEGLLRDSRFQLFDARARSIDLSHADHHRILAIRLPEPADRH